MENHPKKLNIEDLAILVVEDQIGMRRIIRTVLQAIGVKTILEAQDGAQALLMLTSRNSSLVGGLAEGIGEETRAGSILKSVDLVIADWSMPILNGMEMIESMRQQTYLKDIPVIMLTAENSREQILQALKLGVSDYIIKPFTTNLLEAKLKSLFEDRFGIDF